MLCLFILFTTQQSHPLLNEVVLNKKISLVQGIEELSKINDLFNETMADLLITYDLYHSVTDEQAFARETMILPVVEETVLQNIVQTVETNEEVRQEDLEAFLRLFKRNVSSKPKKAERSTGPSKKREERQKKTTIFKTISRYSYFSVALLIFLAVGVFTGAAFGSQSKPTSQNDSKLEERLTHLQEQVHEQPQVDVVARFFLSSLYSGEESDKATQKQVKKYVSEGVLKEIKGSKEQIRTLFLWESKKEGNQWLLTYVVTLKMAKEATETRQITVSMEKKENSYRVTKLPEEKEFTINE
ncbi:TPA: type III secretion system protein PrgD [Enterococcus faecalis]|uniref:type III secretion system protein PrgD n=1 Tax=Enterococcus faecalis TaxID=1351 RepID=UPI000F64F111|nr:type III secretion system protein PrgD [Enterococcus faecalis]NSO80887.1 type III secretion system protein PrgD [Enterococcus faecalis]RRQ91519.1 type III secretion system protein PrgD [Enterococcus faecalis]HAP4570953.1 type III secretion system protein PrgD [Enterococcus faecalis]HAP4577516.1 type III secretion system protein PrgD [Enterococcus faecalis]HAP4580673.1 type III secretion system protein PrgD [Enterococcus faecalis]